jgi:hypothetical protein
MDVSSWVNLAYVVGTSASLRCWNECNASVFLNISTMPPIVVSRIKDEGGSLKLGGRQTFRFTHAARVIVLFPSLASFATNLNLLTNK